MNILVLAAHPDDEVLGCGGTILRYVEEGHDVHIAILGEGMTSRNTAEVQVPQDNIADLQSTASQVAANLGARSFHQFQLPDNRFDSVPMLDVVKIIERLLDDLNPEVVFTQHGGDLNVDHVVLFRATLTATRPIHPYSVRAVYAYEVNSSSEWSFGKFSPTFAPDTFVDIAPYLAGKISAMEAYESEARPFPHPRSPKSLTAQAQRWGSTVGLEAAEAFQTVRNVYPKGRVL